MFSYVLFPENVVLFPEMQKKGLDPNRKHRGFFLKTASEGSLAPSHDWNLQNTLEILMNLKDSSEPLITNHLFFWTTFFFKEILFFSRPNSEAATLETLPNASTSAAATVGKWPSASRSAPGGEEAKRSNGRARGGALVFGFLTPLGGLVYVC